MIRPNVGSTRLAVTFVAVMVGFGSPQRLHAIPVTYQLVVFGVNGTPTTEIPGPVVQIGNNTYGAIGQEIKVTFTFQADTSNVDAYSIPGASGYEIRIGTASVLVQDSSNLSNVLFQGTFDPTALIFVSIDNTNLGIGFGSKAVWPPTAPGFPGQPVYPLGYYIWFLSQARTYDLKSDFNTGLIETFGIVGGWSCSSGPPFYPCATPPTPLPLTNGETFTFSLLPPLNSNVTPPLPNPVGFFQTTTLNVTLFSAFNAKLDISGTPPTRFDINSSFTLGTGSNGINPISEPVTLELGAFSVTVPAGSFIKTSKGQYVYEGTVDGVALQVQIAPMSGNSYSFKAEGSGANLSGTTNSVTVTLTIGDDKGATTATAQALVQ